MSLAGLPALSLRWPERGPAHRSPVVAPHFGEERLLAAAQVLERTLIRWRRCVDGWETVMAWRSMSSCAPGPKMFAATGPRSAIRLTPTSARYAWVSPERCPSPMPRRSAWRYAAPCAGAVRCNEDQRLRPEELFLSRSAQRLPDLAVRPAVQPWQRQLRRSPERGECMWHHPAPRRRKTRASCCTTLPADQPLRFSPGR